MANCKYCEKPAGFLRYTHKDCDSKFQNGRTDIVTATLSAIQEREDFAALKDRVTSISSQSFISLNEQQNLLISAWEQAVEKFLEDGVLDATEESRLVECKNYFLLNDTDLDKNGYLTKTAKAGALRDLMDGKIPKRVSVDHGVALNLQKNEQIIWAFPNSEYLEDKIRRQFVGRSSGVSVRVMKGVYYRTSVFKGHPVEYTERVSIGKGMLVLTNKNIYFHGPLKSFRIPYQKIVSFEPYSNGIGITKDAANAKTQTFINGDGWFIYNVLSNINNI
jgi:hypothetical protein